MQTPSTVPLPAGLVNRVLTNIENWLATVLLAYMRLRQNSVAPYHLRKNIYFRYFLQYYCTELEKLSIDTQFHQKKKIVSEYSTAMGLMCLIKFFIRLDSH